MNHLKAFEIFNGSMIQSFNDSMKKAFPILGILTAILLSYALYMALVWAPTERTMGDVQRIVYIHVPVAWFGMIALLAMAISADSKACIVTLETIRLVHQKLGLNITMGASNISFGLPGRESLNSAFISLAIFNGLTCPIANPEKITAAIRSADLALGRDDFAVRFVEYFQSRL